MTKELFEQHVAEEAAIRSDKLTQILGRSLMKLVWSPWRIPMNM